VKELYTVTDDRPDLADVEVNEPDGYIAQKVIPTVPVGLISSKFRYMQKVADSAAETGRVDGEAPNKVRIANAEGTFTCVDLIKRSAVSPNEAKHMGGIEKADEVGTKFSKRQVLGALEEKSAVVVMDKAALDAFDPVNLLAQKAVAMAALKGYHGKLSLVAAGATLDRMFKALVVEAEIGAMFVRIVSGTAPGVAIDALTEVQRHAAVAAYLGVKQVFTGDDEIWAKGSREGKFALAILDDGADELVYKYQPVFARRFQFLPDGVNPWSLRSIADEVNIDNLYDAKVWEHTLCLNDGARVTFDGVQ